MPELEVIETEQVATPAEPETPSPSENADPIVEEPQTPATGEEEIKPGEEEIKPAETEPTANDPKAERREMYWKRQAEKHERELNDLKTKQATPEQRPPQFTPEQMIKGLATKYGYDPEDPNVKALIPMIQEIAASVSERMVSPLQHTVYSSQYEIRKTELAKDPKYGKYLANPDIMAVVDKMAKGVPATAFTNAESLKSLIRYTVGDPDMQEIILKNASTRAAKKATQEKRIDSVVSTGGSKIAGVESKGRLTAKQSEIARKMGIPEDKFLKNLQEIEKSKGK